MVHTPKNSTQGYTESWKRERDRLTNYYQDNPYYGSKTAKGFYDSVKKIIPSVIQVSHCGPIVQITTYKQDEGKARQILSIMFKSGIKQTTCHYTKYVTTFVINK